MKKVYLGILAISTVSAGFSQQVGFSKNSESKNAPLTVSLANDKESNNVAKASIFTEDFETWPLTGWTIQGGPASTTTAPTQKWHEASTGNPGKCASILYVNSVDQHDEELITPTISIPAGGNYFFSFDFNTSIYWHALTLGGTFDNADIYLQASTDDGASWSSVLWQEDNVALLEASFSEGWQTYVWKRAYVNVSSYAGGDVIFKFTYNGLDAAQFSLDNVSVDEIPANDVSVLNFYQSNDGADYYIVPTSQSSFPGLTFGAKARNLGAGDQPTVTLRVTGDSYDQSSSPVAINSFATDTLSISTPFMIPSVVGDYTVEMTTELGVTDENTANNEFSFVVRRDALVYARDNGSASGGIGQVSSQDGQELSIGNVFDVYNNTTVTGIQIRLTNQALAEGQIIDGKIEIWNGNEFVYNAETDPYTITASDLNTFVTLPISGGASTIPAGSTVLVMAHHYGGANEVEFAMAQPTLPGSVLGRTADGGLFNLLEPRAIMIRLTEDPSLSVNNVSTLEGVKVYPNPSTGLINVTNDSNIENTIVVTDLAGKVITTKVASVSTTLDLSTVGTGVYLVEVSNQNGKKVERVVVQ